jgi:hypothetical protein
MRPQKTLERPCCIGSDLQFVNNSEDRTDARSPKQLNYATLNVLGVRRVDLL